MDGMDYKMSIASSTPSEGGMTFHWDGNDDHMLWAGDKLLGHGKYVASSTYICV